LLLSARALAQNDQPVDRSAVFDAGSAICVAQIESTFSKFKNIMEIQLGEISNIIQLAVAPVFLLTGVGSNLLVLTNRLARIIDRSRVLEDRIEAAADSRQQEYLTEIEILYRRAHLVNRAITLSTTCALLICVVVAALFLGDALGLALTNLIAMLFVTAMLALIGSFVYLLREIFIATGTLSMRCRPLMKR
jgi:hypothetical protein